MRPRSLMKKTGERVAERSAMKEASQAATAWSFRDTVVAYGVSPEIARIASESCKSVGAQFFHSACLTDLLVIPCFLLICDFSAVHRRKLEIQFGYMSEMAKYDNAYKVLLLGTAGVQPPRGIAKALVYAPDPLDVQSLKLLL